MSPASYLTAPPRVATRSIARVRKGVLCGGPLRSTIWRIEPPIEFHDVTTIMALLGNMQRDLARIRELLEDELGEEEEDPEDDA